MSEVISLSAARKTVAPKMRIGLLRLSDGAPVIAAHEFGFFADEGLDVELSVEPSWANIADKLAYGFLDAAVIVPPLAFAVHLGLRGAAQPMLIPYSLSSGGNTVTLNQSLAQETRNRSNRKEAPVVEALASILRESTTTLGIVHAYSTHNLLLRYWLATAGIEVGRDVKFIVVPPARAVEALTSGQIAGFCAGAPWGEVARRAGAGATIATSNDIWRSAPEKALAVRARWADERPEALQSAIRALLRAAKFCDGPENAEYTAALLSRRKYVDVDPHAILADLPGGTTSERGCVFYRGAVTFPWRSQGLWFLNQMRRWALLDDSLDLHALAERVYRPDIYRAAVAPSGEPAPVDDWKKEGGHDEAWAVEALPLPLVLRPDAFCDRVTFDSDTVSPPSKTPVTALHKN
ncbi:CmpA/NrtA family ABC transporter substrate-binding protein [Chelatococcus asaccharovorans]|uniref:CmpA/NrtA family ABC transporter substrate-binding protein n=1 Tax=Chelatococcus asaccharovorans TaxID=28210 RepID=UPI00224C7845|nr:CmpA/NrtA family ABC transporter substrate-binding protein [Chelatococcus asaccharovorans]CAH1661721.1 NitT/TauT family transport system ATP-binding protein/nitrate/nitrite transport system substrate-binding protein [Chelatococcus asaccharovorans]CAH1689529.1 NitT/TauT family transport system ATP-binding protein/nitrate/nitrite transport system substrate-binding protein [Chelatococcus asaccharovorans]